ncbi:MAG: amidohydrolase family protein [Hydrogenophaga sp.]|uniref:amidohydrolase n=1 Tax=Hydrogenophaga sp. TaxID=1904254 RepID=UPI00169E699E|nr:amidohydrolase [Hydrogenophaga sp.]NIM40813.1 amidohydrolase family protein [Hydrogenophaga sp.]NIN26288.1 amidohydrolase family protein [Hydrogenophaga sp.]NIN31153.1 amidohydrolase family protein [Hydrogenophaga sp.]NIN55196.1 amidohydrolase family protein [Hydrogenophaga sp.]NIO51239.1 amidohydrolase family protein [Hydrogenophaga sp.]
MASQEQVLVTGDIVTMDPARPRAQALAVQGARLVAVGTRDEARAALGAAPREIHYPTGTVVPGLIDTHNHMQWTAIQTRLVDLAPARSIADVQEAIRAYARRHPHKPWIMSGSGWHVVSLREGRYPTRQELDAACADRPVYLPRIGHAAVANTLALSLAGIGPDTADPPGGRIERDEHGHATGVLLEPPAFEMVARLVPPSSLDEQLDALRDMQRTYHAAGLTGIMDPGVTPEMMRLYQTLWQRGELSVRSVLMPLSDSSLPLQANLDRIAQAGLATGFGDARLKLGGVKLFLDGGASLGTALMREPYPDERCNCGIQVTPTESFRQIAWACARQGWSLGVHVVGGKAIDIALEVFAEIDKDIPLRPLRFSLIHAYLWPEARNIREAARMGITVATQCSMQYTFGPLLVQRFGTVLMSLATPVRSWIDAGVVVGGGSDSPVTPYQPLLGLWQARTRHIAGTDEPVGRLQAVSGEEALALYTRDAAYVSFSEHERGMLRPGLLADWTVLSVDPVACDPEALRDARVLATAVDGRVVHET